MPRPFPSPLRAVLFDLDGTLVDTAPDFIHVMHTLCEEQGRAALSDDSIYATVSNGARALVELAFKIGPGDAGFSALLERLLSLYQHKLTQSQACLYPGMSELLATLEQNNILWGIVTNKPERFCIPLLQQLGLSERCGTLVCPDHVNQSKPHPEPIHLACNTLGVEPSSAIYIGDHLRDIQAGQAAQLFSIAVEYGYIAQNDAVTAWGADRIAIDVAQLTKQLGLSAT